MSCFLLLFNLDYCLYEALSSQECYLTLHVIFSLVPIEKYRALFDNCLVYSIFLVSNNYLGSNNCSVENNFHLLVNVLFASALLFRLLSVWNIIQFRMSIFYTSHHFPLCSSSEKMCFVRLLSCIQYLSSFQQLSRFKQLFCWKELSFTSKCLVYICSSV